MGAAKSEQIGLDTGQLFRGERIGKYEILTQLSVGGMAELFLAFTAGPGGFRKFVVIKRILPDARNNDSFVRMFLDEARITGALSHPNIAQVFELGGEESGEDLYLAMEFIAGQNLNQIMSACVANKRKLPVGFCAAVVRDVLGALQYAHSFVDSKGQPSPVIHRDVAQKNVMVTYEGLIKLLDFGIAKAKDSLGKTSVGMVKGTTGYMSPEQVRGEELDGRSDVFSAGILLFEILTGHRLFSAETEAEEMERILHAPIPDPSAVDPMVPQRLAAVVNKALSRDRTQRYQSAKAMARALEQAAGPLLFDQERTAAFMKELFENKMAATRALLESAGQTEVTQVRNAATLLRRDVGSVFPAQQIPSNLPQAPPSVLDDLPPGVNLDLPMAKTELATLDQTPLEAKPSSGVSPGLSSGDPTFVPREQTAVTNITPGRSGLIIGVAVLGMLGAILGFRFLSRGPPGALTEFGSGKRGDLSSYAPGKAPLALPKPPVADEGTLTLITQPESSVSMGAQLLGRTPLISVALAPGSHLLTILGPDGKRRLLTVAIKPGENTAVRVNLDDLPSSSVLQ